MQTININEKEYSFYNSIKELPLNIYVSILSLDMQKSETCEGFNGYVDALKKVAALIGKEKGSDAIQGIKNLIQAMFQAKEEVLLSYEISNLLCTEDLPKDVTVGTLEIIEDLKKK